MSALTVRWMPRPTDEEFSAAAPLLERVVRQAVKGEFTVEDLRRLASEGRVLVGIAEREGKPIMAAALELVHYPQFTAMNIMALGGARLLDVANVFFDPLKEFARSCGCKRIEASGSRSMARLLSSIGFEKIYEKVGCEL